MEFKLTKENYFSKEADRLYMSVSQYKRFLPQYGGCEAKALVVINREFTEEEKKAFVEGKYIHAWNEGKLEEFKADNPDIYSSRGATAGQLKSEFKHCNTMIDTLANDAFAMDILAGEKEVILTAEMFGTPWKIMIDSYQPDEERFADLKAVKNISDKFWSNSKSKQISFIENYGYDIQMSVYAEIERLSKNRVDGDWYMPYIVVVDKQDIPDKEVIHFDYATIQMRLQEIEQNMPRILAIKRREEKPTRCEQCDYCRLTKVITESKHYMDIIIR